MANGYRDYSNSPDWAGALSNLSAIIQQSQGRQQQNKQFGMQMQMQQQGMQQAQQRINMEQGRWAEGAEGRAEGLEQMKNINAEAKRIMGERKEYDTLKENLFEIIGDPSEFKFGNLEELLQNPDIQALGPAMGQTLMSNPDLVAPFIEKPKELPFETMLDLGFSYDKLPSEWQGAIPQETWDVAVTDIQKLRESGQLSTEYGLEIQRLTIEDFKNRIAGTGIYKKTSGGVGSGGSEASKYMNAMSVIQMAKNNGYDPPQWALDIAGAKADSGGGGGEFDAFGEQLLRAGQLGNDDLSGKATQIVGELKTNFTAGTLSVEDVKRFADWVGVSYSPTDTVGDIFGYLPEGLIALGQPYLGASTGSSVGFPITGEWERPPSGTGGRGY